MKTEPDPNASRVILLAEDRDDDTILVRLFFQKTGLPHLLLNVTTGCEVVSYLEGLDQFANREQFPQHDLLILDLKMPRMDGFDVLAWLNSSPDRPKVPVVVLSGSERVEDKAMAAQLGARDYYVKSADPNETRDMLNNICSKFLESGHSAELDCA